MLRINSLKNASLYYIKSLTKGDYYSDGGEQIGKWQGLAATKLDLSENIVKEQFDNLSKGLNPFTGDKIATRIDSDRIEGYDFTFSVPKSISLLSAISQNPIFDDILTEAVQETMLIVEQNIQTRVRIGGLNENRITGNMVYGHFLHRNARPINGYSDPHLHIHAVILNLTYDGVENKWKGVNIRDKKENAPYYQSIFNSALALKIQSLGLQIKKTKNNFELAGVDQGVIDTFSRRTKQIEKEIQQKGILSDKLKDQQGARTRKSKSDKHSQLELRQLYLKLIPDKQIQFLKNTSYQLSNRNIQGNTQGDYITKLNKTDNTSLKADTTNPDADRKDIQKENAKLDSARKWVKYTLNDVLERQSAISEQKLIGQILKEGVGETSFTAVTKVLDEYKKEDFLILEQSTRFGSRNNISPLLTSKNVLEQERFVLDQMHKLNSSLYDSKSMLTKSFNNILSENEFLNSKQKEVIRGVLDAGDSISIIEGKAGTGKTTVLNEIKKGIEQDRPSQNILFLAPTIKAVEVLKLEGFENAITIDKYLNQPNDPPREKLPLRTFKSFRDVPKYDTQEIPLDILIIDETSLVSIRQVERLFKEKRVQGNEQWSKIIFVGDGNQHKSIERGDLFKLIKQDQTLESAKPYTYRRSKIEIHSLNTIIRQQNTEAKEAVEMLGLGQTERGIEKFNKLGSIKVIHDDRFRAEEAAKIYVNNLPKIIKHKQSAETITILPERSFANILYGNIAGMKEIQILKEETVEYTKLGLGRNNKVGKVETNSWDKKLENIPLENEHLENKQTRSKKLSVKLNQNHKPTTLIVTVTHYDGQIIHDAVRRELKKHNFINNQDYNFQTIRSLGWTKAQKDLITNYESGQIIQFTGNIKEYKKGDKFEVIEKTNLKSENQTNVFQLIKPSKPNEYLVQNDLFQVDMYSVQYQIKNIRTDRIQEIPINLSPYYNVFQTQDLQLSKGDLIQIQKQATVYDKNGVEHRTNKGSVYQIKEIKSKNSNQKIGNNHGDINLTNGWIIPKDFRDLKSAYYSTSHSSQGQTVDHSVFYTSKQSLPTINKDMVYVANSRFRLTNTILTPDLNEFVKQSIKGEIKPLAMDVIQSPVLQREHQNKVELEQKQIPATR
jgi:conjugative relaxase-like TrwC/TraI family protein